MTNEDIKIIVGAIEEKRVTESKVGAEKEWKRIAFKIAGATMSTFDVTYDEFKEGEIVEVEYVMNGEYKNIKSMKKSAMQLPATTASTPQPPAPTQVPLDVPAGAPMKTFADRGRDTESSIVSQVLIKCVTEMISAGKLEPGSFKVNAANLVEVYKTTKKSLLE